MDNPHTKSVKEVLDFFNVDLNLGLTSDQVEENRRRYGKNELPKEEEKTFYDYVKEVFNDKMALILLMAAVVSTVLSLTEDEYSFTTYAEPAIIFLIIILNGIVQIAQDLKTENTLVALKNYTPEESRVLREGKEYKINSTEIVPGDIVILSSGDKVSADFRVLKVYSSTFEVDESILTGESESVFKWEDAIITDVKLANSEKTNIVFAGTVTVFGRAKVIAVSTGKHSSIGTIQSSIINTDTEKTPLKKSLDNFGDQLSKIIAFICVAVWLINVKNIGDKTLHKNWLTGAIYYLKIAVSLAVAAIPEGLSVVITTSLALGTNRIAKKGGLVRRLKSIETLGCTTVICSDKTGTLTTNNMCVRHVCTMMGPDLLYDITLEGRNFSPFGKVIPQKNDSSSESQLKKRPCHSLITLISVMCNNSYLAYDHKSNSYKGIGEATDNAFLTLAEKLFFEPKRVDSDYNTSCNKTKEDYCSVAYSKIRSLYKHRHSLEFTRERKIVSVDVSRVDGSKFSPLLPIPLDQYIDDRSSSSEIPTGDSVLLIKGAPEYLLRLSSHYIQNEPPYILSLTDDVKSRFLSKVYGWGTDHAFRMIGFAFKLNPNIPEKLQRAQYSEYENNLTFIGIAALEDPLRDGVIDSVRDAQNAGIDVKIITGDNTKTAEAICRKLSLISSSDKLSSVSLTGRDIDLMDDNQLVSIIENAILFSRVEPHHKKRLVSALRANGHVVAMTGDGVNDAPALKKADIGVSMGSGTDVAKFASDMILMNDSFSTITFAVKEGRLIFSNMRQFIRYLISSNIGEVLSILFAVLVGLPEIFRPVQLLWINLITDGLPATALGFNPPDDDIALQPPRDPNEPIVTKWLLFRFVLVGFYVGVATLLGYIWSFTTYSNGPKITFYQLTNYLKCGEEFKDINCSLFKSESAFRAATVSLTVLVVIEMFNALNSISENQSLLKISPLRNIKLLVSIFLSILLHFVVLYTPKLAQAFEIVPLGLEEWIVVLIISFPIILMDELVKFIYRKYLKSRKHKKE